MANNANFNRMSPIAQAARRDSALSAAQNKMESQAADLTKGNPTFGVNFQGPKFGNPFSQIVGGIKSGIHWLTSYDPYKKSPPMQGNIQPSAKHSNDANSKIAQGEQTDTDHSAGS